MRRKGGIPTYHKYKEILKVGLQGGYYHEADYKLYQTRADCTISCAVFYWNVAEECGDSER